MVLFLQKHQEMTQDNLGNVKRSSALHTTSKYVLGPRELANKFHTPLAVIFSEVVGNESLEEKWQEQV